MTDRPVQEFLADIEEIIQATGPIEEASPALQAAIARVRAATIRPTAPEDVHSGIAMRGALRQGLEALAVAQSRLTRTEVDLRDALDRVNSATRSFKC